MLGVRVWACLLTMFLVTSACSESSGHSDEFTLELSSNQSAQIELGDKAAMLSSGIDSDLVFVHDNLIKRLAVDGTLTEIKNSPVLNSDTTLDVLHRTKDGALLAFVSHSSDPDRLRVKNALSGETVIDVGTLTPPSCPSKFDCFGGPGGHEIYESAQGKLSAIARLFFGYDDAYDRMYYLAQAGAETINLSKDPSALEFYAMGWGGDDFALVKNEQDNQLELYNTVTSERTVMMTGEFVVVAAAASPERSAVVLSHKAGLHVYDDSSARPFEAPKYSYSPLDEAIYPSTSSVDVVMLNNVPVVVIHREEKKAFEINVGDQQMMYSYDAAMTGVYLEGLAVSNNRLHIQYEYFTESSGSYEHAIMTFDTRSQGLH